MTRKDIRVELTRTVDHRHKARSIKIFAPGYRKNGYAMPLSQLHNAEIASEYLNRALSKIGIVATDVSLLEIVLDYGGKKAKIRMPVTVDRLNRAFDELLGSQDRTSAIDSDKQQTAGDYETVNTSLTAMIDELIGEYTAGKFTKGKQIVVTGKERARAVLKDNGFVRGTIAYEAFMAGFEKMLTDRIGAIATGRIADIRRDSAERTSPLTRAYVQVRQRGTDGVIKIIIGGGDPAAEIMVDWTKPKRVSEALKSLEPYGFYSYCNPTPSGDEIALIFDDSEFATVPVPVTKSGLENVFDKLLPDRSSPVDGRSVFTKVEQITAPEIKEAVIYVLDDPNLRNRRVLLDVKNNGRETLIRMTNLGKVEQHGNIRIAEAAPGSPDGAKWVISVEGVVDIYTNNVIEDTKKLLAGLKAGIVVSSDGTTLISWFKIDIMSAVIQLAVRKTEELLELHPLSEIAESRERIFDILIESNLFEEALRDLQITLKPHGRDAKHDDYKIQFARYLVAEICHELDLDLDRIGGGVVTQLMEKQAPDRTSPTSEIPEQKLKELAAASLGIVPAYVTSVISVGGDKYEVSVSPESGTYITDQGIFVLSRDREKLTPQEPADFSSTVHIQAVSAEEIIEKLEALGIGNHGTHMQNKYYYLQKWDVADYYGKPGIWYSYSDRTWNIEWGGFNFKFGERKTNIRMAHPGAIFTGPRPSNSYFNLENGNALLDINVADDGAIRVVVSDEFLSSWHGSSNWKDHSPALEKATFLIPQSSKIRTSPDRTSPVSVSREDIVVKAGEAADINKIFIDYKGRHIITLDTSDTVLNNVLTFNKAPELATLGIRLTASGTDRIRLSWGSDRVASFTFGADPFLTVDSLDAALDEIFNPLIARELDSGVKGRQLPAINRIVNNANENRKLFLLLLEVICDNNVLPAVRIEAINVLGTLAEKSRSGWMLTVFTNLVLEVKKMSSIRPEAKAAISTFRKIYGERSSDGLSSLRVVFGDDGEVAPLIDKLRDIARTGRSESLAAVDQLAEIAKRRPMVVSVLVDTVCGTSNTTDIRIRAMEKLGEIGIFTPSVRFALEEIIGPTLSNRPKVIKIDSAGPNAPEKFPGPLDELKSEPEVAHLALSLLEANEDLGQCITSLEDVFTDRTSALSRPSLMRRGRQVKIDRVTLELTGISKATSGRTDKECLNCSFDVNVPPGVSLVRGELGDKPFDIAEWEGGTTYLNRRTGTEKSSTFIIRSIDAASGKIKQTTVKILPQPKSNTQQLILMRTERLIERTSPMVSIPGTITDIETNEAGYTAFRNDNGLLWLFSPDGQHVVLGEIDASSDFFFHGDALLFVHCTDTQTKSMNLWKKWNIVKGRKSAGFFSDQRQTIDGGGESARKSVEIDASHGILFSTDYIATRNATNRVDLRNRKTLKVEPGYEDLDGSSALELNDEHFVVADGDVQLNFTEFTPGVASDEQGPKTDTGDSTSPVGVLDATEAPALLNLAEVGKRAKDAHKARLRVTELAFYDGAGTVDIEIGKGIAEGSNGLLNSAIESFRNQRLSNDQPVCTIKSKNSELIVRNLLDMLRSGEERETPLVVFIDEIDWNDEWLSDKREDLANLKNVRIFIYKAPKLKNGAMSIINMEGLITMALCAAWTVDRASLEDYSEAFKLAYLATASSTPLTVNLALLLENPQAFINLHSLSLPEVDSRLSRDVEMKFKQYLRQQELAGSGV